MTEVRYCMDEYVASAVTSGLRSRGVDVLTVVGANMRGVSDTELLQFARREGRVVFTHDTDFLRLAAADSTHAGIVFAPRQKSIGDQVRALLLIHQVVAAEDMIGKIEFV